MRLLSMKYYNNWKIILNILLAEWKIISSKVALKRKLYLICKINRLINEFVICSSNWNHLIFHYPSLKIWKGIEQWESRVILFIRSGILEWEQCVEITLFARNDTFQLIQRREKWLKKGWPSLLLFYFFRV